MGNCVSASKGQGSALNFGFSVADARPSALVEPPVNGTAIGIPSSAAELNTKEEVFFDSQPWLESDCEDFFSVNGDTPTGGNSPVHPKIFREQSLPDKSSFPMKAVLINDAESPVAELKKQLHELFNESFRANPVEDKLGGGLDLLPPDSASRSPSVKKAKSSQSPRCCIPNLVRSLSFGERKKRMKPVVYGCVA